MDDGNRFRTPRALRAGPLVFAASLAIALTQARPYAGCWNDGSRLATVECLVDHHTLAIDRSIFVRDNSRADLHRPPPYPAHDTVLLRHGTLDKLFVSGHFYSDKSPVPALLLAAWYQLWQWATGWTAARRPDLFCYGATVASSGLAYCLALRCVYLLGRPLGLALPLRLALTASLGLCTVAFPYTRHVNNHILLLGVSTALVLQLAWLAEDARAGRPPGWRPLALGFLAGLGYAIDLGAGPVLLLSTAGLVGWRCRRAGPVALVVLGALPWLALHHALNYRVGGTLGPANAVPAYFRWPGSPFGPANLTGAWNHPDPGTFLLYAAGLLFGKRGFIGHNLPLFLTLPALAVLLRRRTPERPELVWAVAYAGGAWLLYATTSNNSSGACCSVRWFVPLLAPGYYILAVLLRRCPRYRRDFLLLSAWGGVLVALMAEAPWQHDMVPLFWPVQGAALLSWGAVRLSRRLRARRAGGVAGAAAGTLSQAPGSVA
jgi:hypothetical protein